MADGLAEPSDLVVEVTDEAGAIVMAGPTSPWVGGIVYCGIVWSCLNVADWSRASQWSEQFSHWCSRHGDLSYPGLCRLHRAELLCCQGSLREAEREARQAREILARSAPYAEGDAYRVLGDALLRQGRLAEAEALFEKTMMARVWEQARALSSATRMRELLETRGFERDYLHRLTTFHGHLMVGLYGEPTEGDAQAEMKALEAQLGDAPGGLGYLRSAERLPRPIVDPW